MAKLLSRAIGALRHRLVIEAPVDVDDGAGGVTRAYLAVDEAWAAIELVGAEAALVDNRPGARLTHRIVLRWRADMDGGRRLRLGARVFRIHAIADADERRRRLVILAEEETP